MSQIFTVNVPANFWNSCFAALEALPYRHAQPIMEKVPKPVQEDPPEFYEVELINEEWDLLGRQLGEGKYVQVAGIIDFLRAEINKQQQPPEAVVLD